MASTTRTIILDGSAFAARRADGIASRAAAVRAASGEPPRLLLMAFGDSAGRAPHVHGKLRAADAAGIDVEVVVVPAGLSTAGAEHELRDALARGRFDGVFVQFPWPDGVDGDAICAAIPADLDLDVMTLARTGYFMMGPGQLPPITVAAGLLLLDEYGIAVERRRGIVVAEENPLALMFRVALARRGAQMLPLAEPGAFDLEDRVAEADLIIVAAGVPGLLKAASLPFGAVAIDVGYFNPGGTGDIDLTGGFEHLHAIAPVPGGIGPMTVSVLLERVVLFAERNRGP
jgi:methylenetetrahydrofolate dehydrogenase (NADP+) / methenyltetrahydrofolate cyclohydrolase